MLSLSDNIQADVVEAFNSSSRYLNHLLDIDNPYFEQMVSQIYHTGIQLNKANSSDIETPFLDLDLSITNDIVSIKNCYKRDDFNFEIDIFHFLMEMLLAPFLWCIHEVLDWGWGGGSGIHYSLKI